MGNSKRSIHLVVIVAFAVMIISTSFAVAHGLVSVVNRLTWGYTVTDLYIVYQGGAPLVDSRLNAGLFDSLSEGVTYSPVSMCVVSQSIMGRLTLYGVDREAFTAVRRPNISGELPDTPGEALAGYTLAQRYGILPGSIFEVDVEGVKHIIEITGIIRCHASYDLGLVTTHDLYVQLSGTQGEVYQFAELRVLNVDEFNSGVGSSYGLEIKPIMAMQDYISAVTEEIRGDLVLLSLIIGVIVSFLVGHTMYKIVYDSVNELRVIRSLGVTRRGLLWLIIVNSTLLSFFGAAIGLFLGIVFANILSIGVFILLKSVYYPARIETVMILYCLGLSVFLGLLGGASAIVFVKPEKRIVEGGYLP